MRSKATDPGGAPARRHGTQSIERAIVLLKELSSRAEFGWRLSDLAERCGIDVGTAHRILGCLVEERLAHQRASDRHYLPGPLLFELGLSQVSLAAFQAACEAPVRRIARRFRAMAFVYLRSGNDVVCSSVAGQSTVKAMAASVGTRRPMIASAGGLAILIGLPKAEARAINAENLRRMQHLGAARIAALERMLRNSQRRGYGIHAGDVVPGVSTFSVPIPGEDGLPIASLSVGGAAAVLPAESADEYITALRDEAATIAADPSWRARL